MPNTPAVFVRSVSSGLNVGGSVSLNMQVDIGDLVVVGAFSDTLNPDNLTVTDSLGNIYTRAVQGLPGDYGQSGVAGDALIAYTIVTHAGVATITNTSSASPHALGVMASEYTIPAGMGLSQVGWWIGDIDPSVFGGNPATDVAAGTEPVDYSNSLVMTLMVQGGWCLDFTSPQGDTQRGFVHNPAGSGHGGTGAMFEAIYTTPGIRNSTMLARVDALGCNDTPSRNGITNILIAVFSVALTRPGGLTSQAAIRPGKSGILGQYNGQTDIVVSLPYMPVIGSLVLVGCQCNYGGGVTPVPTFTPTDTYGNVYSLVPGGTFHDAFGSLQVNAMFFTVVTALPTTGNFTVTVSMVPFPVGTGAQSPKSITLAEYSLPGMGSPQAYVYTASTPIGGGLMRLQTVNFTVGNDTLVAGFGAANYGSGTPIPVTWTPSGGYALDTQWGEWQVDVNALPNRVTLGTGDWFHQYFTLGTTTDGETDVLATAGSIMVVAVPFSSALPFSAMCPIDGTSATVGVFYDHVVVVSGGVPPFTFTLALFHGNLPPGLTLDSTTGVISGTPTEAGIFPYEVHITDSSSPPQLAIIDCVIIVVQITTCVRFRLMKVMATMKPATHLPVRGSTK